MHSALSGTSNKYSLPGALVADSGYARQAAQIPKLPIAEETWSPSDGKSSEKCLMGKQAGFRVCPQRADIGHRANAIGH